MLRNWHSRNPHSMQKFLIFQIHPRGRARARMFLEVVWHADFSDMVISLTPFLSVCPKSNHPIPQNLVSGTQPHFKCTNSQVDPRGRARARARIRAPVLGNCPACRHLRFFFKWSFRRSQIFLSGLPSLTPEYSEYGIPGTHIRSKS